MQTLIDWVIGWTGNGQYAIIFFPFLVALLIFTSLRLVKYAEMIIARTKFGSGFVGGALVAGITSAPELVTEITQGLAGHPEHGTGDNLGSNAFNTLLIGVGAFFFLRYLFLNNLSWWTRVTLSLSLGGGLAMALVLGINRWVGRADINAPYLGIVPAIFFAFYLITLGLNYKFGASNDPIDEKAKNPRHSLRKVAGLFGLWSISLILIAVALNIDVNAFQVGLNIPSESVGGIFLAITTSAPEIVAFFAFMRRRQPAAAVAAVSGSHFFNLGIAFFGDLAYHHGPSFNNAAMGRQFPLAIIASLTLAFLIAHFLLARRFPRAFKKRRFYLIFPTLMVLTYALGWTMTLLYN